MIYLDALLAWDMLITCSVNINITKEIIKEEQMMSTKAKTLGGGLCQASEYRWENPNGNYRLFGLVNSNLDTGDGSERS